MSVVDGAMLAVPAPPPPTRTGRTRTLLYYFLLSYLAILVNSAWFLSNVSVSSPLTAAFAVGMYVSYAAIYLLPALIVSLLVDGLLSLRPATALFTGAVWPARLVFGVAVVLTALTQIGVFADRFIFDMYGFHLNGFVWNLITTPGGLDSLGGGNNSTISFTLICLGFVGLQLALMAAVRGGGRMRARIESFVTGRRAIALVAALLAATALERLAYGVSHLYGYRPVLAATSAFPFYLPTTLTNLARRLGVDVQRERTLSIDVGSIRLNYPRRPIERVATDRPLNIVWLVAESLREDMVDPTIMPATHAFAQRAVWFRHHYSGGNGTRMGMFSMFYGLYGCLWFEFFDERRGPVLMDVVLDAGYQMELFTSASFTYPEFDRTLFARVPSERLHQAESQAPWRRDRENVEKILSFIEHRDPARPFMTFMFFESPHAKYHFPQECAIRQPYAQELNYATMNLHRDIELIKNRYINSCNHLDTQIARVLDRLEQRALLDSTIVIITGDHGEEFMEKGRWGHNSAFTEEQTRPPLVLWVPGQPPRQVTRMTSHMDIPATLLPLLGVTNPAEDYTLGQDLLGEAEHAFVIACDWNNVAYIDSRHKAVFPLKAFGLMQQDVTTKNDEPLADPGAFYQANKARLIEIMRSMRAFGR